MDVKKLQRLLKKEEGTKLDFKLRLELWNETGKKELAKDVCAIANSKGGRGYIVVGIIDKSKVIEGIKEEELFKEEQIQQIISSRCEPPIPVKVDFLDIKDKKVGVITILTGEQKPYQVRENGAFYIRRGSTTDIMRKQELLRIFEENLDLTIETSTIARSDISLLDNELLERYFNKKGIKLTEENKIFLLESTGIINIDKETGEEKCTYGGLLVFSEENSLCIPNNMIRIINRVNKKIDEINIIQGSLITMILKSEELIKNIVPTSYPIVAIMEAIKNAILYRAYSEVNRVIEVVISQNSVVIDSPGELIQKNIQGKNINYIRRNMWLYEKLITLDDKHIILNSGSGFSKMKNSFKGIGKVKLVNSKEENSFKVILPGTKI